MKEAKAEKERLKKLAEVKKDLLASDDVIVLDAINRVKEVGDSSIIYTLAEVLSTTENATVKKEVKHVFTCLKQENVDIALLEVIKNEKFNSIKNFIISAFWESGIDASKHLLDFIEITTKGDYMTAVEVMTLVDQMEHMDKEDIEEAMLILNKERDGDDANKNSIHLSIIEILNEKLIGS